MKISQFKKMFQNHQILVGGNAPDGLEITSLCCDSRDAIPGSLFFCKGAKFRFDYLQRAAQAGACAYVSEVDYGLLPTLLVSDIRAAMPLAGKAFAGAPDEKFPLIGITGTKGKTTCAYFLQSILSRKYGFRVGLISTNEALSLGQRLKKSGTTPEPLELYSLLERFASDRVGAAIMEVSSQGLQYRRVEHIDFAVGVFLNLSPDHISPTEHKDFEEYKAAKQKMLTLCRAGVVNLDDPYSGEILRSATCRQIQTVSLIGPADWTARDIRGTRQGVSFRINGPGCSFPVHLSAAGDFNVSNALCAAAAAAAVGGTPEQIQEGLEASVIPGRMEQFSVAGRQIIVDYAHNRLSFEKIFEYTSQYFSGVFCTVLFGCPGNKAPGRRKDLPEVAAANADLIILTDDDPADEEPEAIFRECAAVLALSDVPYRIIPDRREAILAAIEATPPGGLVLLLGKGHETTQIVRGRAIEYGGDRKCALGAVATVSVES